MSEMLLDFLAILKLFTAGIMCVGGIALTICYCCFLRDIDDIKLGPQFSKKTIQEYIENEEAQSGQDETAEDAPPKKKSFENESCTVEDETKGAKESQKA